MSNVTLCCMLRMPREMALADPLSIEQHFACCLDAAQELERLLVENAELRACAGRGMLERVREYYAV